MWVSAFVKVLQRNRAHRMDVSLHSKGRALEGLTCCGPSNPTMADCESQVQVSSSFHSTSRMSHSVVSLCWNPKQAGSRVREGRDVTTSREQADNRDTPIFPALYRLPAEGVARMRGGASTNKDPD